MPVREVAARPAAIEDERAEIITTNPREAGPAPGPVNATATLTTCPPHRLLTAVAVPAPAARRIGEDTRRRPMSTTLIAVVRPPLLLHLLIT